jgi:hypothetical protein
MINHNHGDYENSPAGLIPSPELQEWRIATNAIEKAKDGSGTYRSLHTREILRVFFLLQLIAVSLDVNVK